MPTSKNSIPIYLSDEEKDKLQELAKVWGTSMSSALRRLLREKKIPQE